MTNTNDAGYCVGCDQPLNTAQEDYCRPCADGDTLLAQAQTDIEGMEAQAVLEAQADQAELDAYVDRARSSLLALLEMGRRLRE